MAPTSVPIGAVDVVRGQRESGRAGGASSGQPFSAIRLFPCLLQSRGRMQPIGEVTWRSHWIRAPVLKMRTRQSRHEQRAADWPARLRSLDRWGEPYRLDRRPV